jgi:protein-tyrosine kinase
MSRLNKALERIKAREASQNDPVFMDNALKQRALRSSRQGIPDPVAKAEKMAVLHPEAMREHHLITEDIDPVVLTSYKMLRTRILKSMRSNGWQSLAVTSATQGDGKTITAINLAISLAGDVNHNVCLVDLDLRHSSVASYLDLDVEYGISDCLSGNVPLEKAIVRTNIDRLTVLPNLGQVHDSSELLSSPSMRQFTEMLAADPNRLVIYDMPPILAADDMLTFDQYVDAVLFVISEGKTNRTDAIKARELMVEMNVLGTVLNRSDEKTATYY